MNKKGPLILLFTVVLFSLCVVNAFAGTAGIESAVNSKLPTLEIPFLQSSGLAEPFSFFRPLLEKADSVLFALDFLTGFPMWVLSCVSIIVKLTFTAGVMYMKPSPFKQGGGFVIYRPLTVLSNGILGYFAFLTLIIVFLFSVFGFIIAAVFVIITWILTVLGEISLGLTAGYLLCDSLQKLIQMRRRANITAIGYSLLGVVIIELLRRIPIIGYVASMFMLPIICVGIILTIGFEGYIKKVFFDLPFWEKKSNISSNTRDIVLQGIE